MTLVTNLDAAPSAFPQAFAPAIASFARPADITAYGANTIVSDSKATAAVLQFPGVGPSGAVWNAYIAYGDVKTVDFDLFLFSAEPTNFIDGAAIAFVAADQAKLLGVLKFTNAQKVNIAAAIDFYRAVGPTDLHATPISYATATGKLYGVLVARTAFTPIASSKVVVTLHIDRGTFQ